MLGHRLTVERTVSRPYFDVARSVYFLFFRCCCWSSNVCVSVRTDFCWLATNPFQLLYRRQIVVYLPT